MSVLRWRGACTGWYHYWRCSWIKKLKRLISMNSDVLVIDDVAPTVVEGFAFDIELIPEAKPVRQPLGKLSPQQMAKEAYHLEKEERLGHLRTPTDEQKSEWAFRTHVVWKKDDEHGRWICDFRLKSD